MSAMAPHDTNDVCAQSNSRCARTPIPQWDAYEAAKRAWMTANENATGREYEAAMQVLLERLGL